MLTPPQYLPFLRTSGPVNLYPYVTVLSTGQVRGTACSLRVSPEGRQKPFASHKQLQGSKQLLTHPSLPQRLHTTFFSKVQSLKACVAVQVMMIGYRESAIYTTSTYALANTTVRVPDLPRPVSYPYTASILLLPLVAPAYINRVSG